MGESKLIQGLLTAQGSAPLTLVLFKDQLYIKYIVYQMVVSALEKNRDGNRKVGMRVRGDIGSLR